MGLRSPRVWAFVVVFGLAALSAATAHAYIYWGSNGANHAHDGTTLNRADLDGSGIDRSFVTDASGPIAMDIESGKLYWLNFGTDTIGSVDLSGSDPDPTLFSASGAELAVDQSYVYWISSYQYVGRAELNGSDPQPHFINLGDESTIDAIGASDGTIYVAVNNGTTVQIETIPAGGGPASTIATLSNDVQAPTSFAIAGGYLYFSLITNLTAQTGVIGRVPVTGGTPDESFIPDAGLSYGVATDGTYVYWTSYATGTIGRALIGSEGATDIENSFITDPNGPWGIAVDDNTDPTTTAVSCLHTTVAPGATVPCTATVSDTASSSPPTGSVNFAAPDTATLLGNPCTLGLIGGVAQCTVSVAPAAASRLTISATYGGDSVHETSSGSTPLCAGSATQCGAPPPKPKPTSQPKCTVPKLKGKTLASARKLLGKAHCELGKVTKPQRGHELVVASTKPRAGTKLANGAKIAVRLGSATSRRR